jgi:hypothetical protein
MLLNEFFGKPIDIQKEMAKTSNDQEMHDDLYWYIVDHDKLHKDYVIPLAKKIYKDHKNNNLDKEKYVMEFMPLVNKGCMEYYHHKKMKGHLGKTFTEELRKELCEKLFNHFREDIVKDKYKLGR